MTLTNAEELGFEFEETRPRSPGRGRRVIDKGVGQRYTVRTVPRCLKRGCFR